MELRASVAVVTGASSGIGWAAAVALARQGASVVVSGRRTERLDALVSGIRERGGAAAAVSCDVGDNEQVEALRDRVHDMHGRCDVLVNNAGIPGGGPFLDLSVERMEAVVRTNVLGVLYGTKAFLPAMVDAGRGHVVNVASLAGRFAVPGSAVYSATKHAVVAFSEALYYDLHGSGVVVTAVNPGLVTTEAFPHADAVQQGRRVMEPERIARTIVDVVKRDKGPEVSIPRILSAAQAVRVLAPPLYRYGIIRFTKGSLRATRASE